MKKLYIDEINDQSHKNAGMIPGPGQHLRLRDWAEKPLISAERRGAQYSLTSRNNHLDKHLQKLSKNPGPGSYGPSIESSKFIIRRSHPYSTANILEPVLKKKKDELKDNSTILTAIESDGSHPKFVGKTLGSTIRKDIGNSFGKA